MRFRLLLLMLAFFAGSAAADERAALRAAFQQALTAAQQGQPVTRSQALQGYVLWPYVEAAELRRLIALDRPEADREWPAFRARHPQHVENRELEREWWRSLGRRQQWAALRAAVPTDPGEADLRCLQARAGIELGAPESELVPLIQGVFLTGSSLPEACTRPFEWLRDRGQRPASLVAQRLRLALDANEFSLARYLLRLLPETDPAKAEGERALQLRSAPEKAIPALVENPRVAYRRDDLFVGWRRWIGSNAEAAARLAPRLAQMPGLDEAERSRVWGELGLRLSWRRDPEAMAYFRRAGTAADELTHAWRLRAAFWNGDWKQAETWFETLPEALAAEPRWQYWRARTAEQLGRSEAAQARYRELLDANNAYAALAAWRLGEGVQPRPRPGAPRDAAEQARLAALPAVQRMAELHALGLRSLFNREWFPFLAAEEARADQLSHYAFDQGWWLHGVAAATRVRLFDDFLRLYPRPYDAEVEAAAGATGVPPAVLYAVIRQESLYDAGAVSRANAYGLMQLLLPTAEGVARRHALPRPRREDLFTPARNVALGSRYLLERRERYGCHWLPAFAAYNAGAGNVDRWLPAAPMAADVWVENIPFNETREYVGKLLWHQTVFAWLASGQPQRVESFLGPVQRPPAP
jgi:soluble lytic murein transglycosylase